jgi:hypothetical protein
MAINFVQGNVAVADPNPGGPTALSNVKSLFTKVVRLNAANFNTTQVNALVAVLPADATILDMRLTVRTQLAGGGITAATLSLGTASAGTQFVNASTAAFGTAGANASIATVTGIFQNYALPLGGDIQVWAGGAATTGNPTSGELYLTILYAR